MLACCGIRSIRARSRKDGRTTVRDECDGDEDRDARAEDSAVLACAQQGVPVLPSCLHAAARRLRRLPLETGCPRFPHAWLGLLSHLTDLQVSAVDIPEIRLLASPLGEGSGATRSTGVAAAGSTVLPQLHTLVIRNCGRLASVEIEWSVVPALQVLKCENCDALQRLSLGAGADSGASATSATSLRELCLVGLPLRECPLRQPLVHLEQATVELPRAVPDVRRALLPLLTGAALQQLQVHRSLDTQLPDGLLEPLCGLRQLNVAHNTLTALPAACTALAALESLCAGGNRLTAWPAVLLQLTALRRIELWENGIEYGAADGAADDGDGDADGDAAGAERLVPPAADGCPTGRVDTALLQHNALLTVPAALLSGALTHLDVSHNRLWTLPGTALAGCTALTVLALEHNRLPRLPDAVGRCVALRSLTLDHNQLTRLPDTLAALPALTVLSAAHNRLAALPDTLTALTSLRVLNASHNVLSVLPHGRGRGCTVLRKLFLSHNSLDALPDSLAQATSLLEMDVSENNLTILPAWLSQLTSLASLSADGNPLRAEQATRYNMGMRLAGSKRAALWDVDPAQITLQQRLGAGSFGEVWRAVYRGETVAVKRMQPAPRETPSAFQERFSREVRFLREVASQNFRNVIRFLGACLAPAPYIVLEYASRGTLETYLAREQPDPQRRLAIALDIAWGLFYLHCNDPPIVHGDLKPDNILIMEDETAKISDFGLTRFRSVAPTAGAEAAPADVTAPMSQAPSAASASAPPASVELGTAEAATAAAAAETESPSKTLAAQPLPASGSGTAPPPPPPSSEYSTFPAAAAATTPAAATAGADTALPAYAEFGALHGSTYTDFTLSDTPAGLALVAAEPSGGPLAASPPPAVGRAESRVMDATSAPATRKSSVVDRPPAASRREPQTLIFFPPYAAPEVILRQPVTPAADIFSLGVLMLEMFTGERAYGSMSSADVCRYVCAGHEIAVPERVPAALAALLRQCLSRTPAARPTATRLCAMLGQLGTLSSSSWRAHG